MEETRNMPGILETIFRIKNNNITNSNKKNMFFNPKGLLGNTDNFSDLCQIISNNDKYNNKFYNKYYTAKTIVKIMTMKLLLIR